MNHKPLPSPSDLMSFLPSAGTPVQTHVAAARERVRRIVHGLCDRLLVVIGPCSIHDPVSALHYARKLRHQQRLHALDLEIVMRVYFEKPRTTIGWKGLINDPDLDGSFRVNEGLARARQLLLDVNRMGLPVASEMLDVVSPLYIGDLIAWGAIGARTTESQTHREMASGLGMPVGFKNGTDGNVKIAADAVYSASRSHHYLGINERGHVVVVETDGNPDGHVILRGGKLPNYDAESVASAAAVLRSDGRNSRLMIDCSHGNSAKQHQRQIQVAADVAGQLASGCRTIMGVMVESHIEAGAQAFTAGKDDPEGLAYGVSITDGCLGWDDSANVLNTLAAAVRERRSMATAAPAEVTALAA